MMVPLSFNRAQAMLAVDGNPEALSKAFVWTETPQGYRFWFREAVAKSLSAEAADILRQWLLVSLVAAEFRPGDMVRALVSENPGEEFTRGKEYRVESSDGIYVNVDACDGGYPNGWFARFFELSQREEAA